MDQPFILCMPRLLIHKIGITGRIVVHIKICLRPQIKVGVEGGIAIRYLGHCYRLNACVLPESICWNLIPRVMVLGGGAYGKCLGHESEGLMNGISFFIKGTPESFLASSSIWQSIRKTVVYEPGSGSSPDTQSAGPLISDFLTLRIVRSKCLLFKPPVYGIFVITAHGLRHHQHHGTPIFALNC